MLALLLVGALLAAPAQRAPSARRATRQPAATPPARPADRWPLAAIRVAGNQVFPAGAILRAAGLQLGALITLADLQAAAQRLTDSGAFATLSFRYEPEGAKLAVLFQVQEVVDLYPVGFERLEIPDAELNEVLTGKVPLFGPQVPATGAMVKRIEEALEACLAERNKPIRVVGRLVSASGGKLVMTFRPSTAPPVITFVKFAGSSAWRAEDLQKAFFPVAVGVPYTEARLAELLEHSIRPLFEEKGRLKVRFGPFRVEESTQASGLVVTVPVEDGEEFRFGRIRFPAHGHVSEKDLVRLARLEEDELANFKLVNQALENIAARYRREGYLRARTALEKLLVEKHNTVDLVIRIEEGDQYLFRRLEIKGIDVNSAAAVRQRWALKRGQPFDSSYPEVFLKRIEDEAMFDRLSRTAHLVTIEEETRMVDVELTFKGEAPRPRVVR